MRKSGLHKQISSIFDGVPMPKNNTVSEDADATSVLKPTTDAETAEMATPQQSAPPATEAENQAPKSSLVKRLSADPSECTSTPSIQVDRPMPLPKSTLSTHKSGPGFSATIKKSLFGSGTKSLDPHQKKMAAMVGVLAVVFAVVMYISLGGVGKSQANTADDKSNDSSNSTATIVNPQDWKSPEPLPANLRDASEPASNNTSSKKNGSTAASANPGELVVKGIVFSKTKPSAIINTQILSEGETINGIRIVKITKNAVEFEGNGNRWTQNVKR